MSDSRASHDESRILRTCRTLPAGVDPSPFPLTRYRHPATEVTPVPLPDWWPNDERQIVYVSFGSVAATFPPAAQMYAAALAAVAQLPVRVLLTLGGNELDLGDLPSNVHVESWVSEPDVFARASVAVGHGGTGTTLSALAAGCPLVVVPLFGDPRPTTPLALRSWERASRRRSTRSTSEFSSSSTTSASATPLGRWRTSADVPIRRRLLRRLTKKPATSLEVEEQLPG